MTIASGDKLVVTDSSDSSKIARTSVSFDGSTTTKALTPKGTFETFLQSHQSVTANNPTLAWSTTSTVGSVGSTALKVTLPANPNTDTKNTAGSTDTSSKIFLVGATSQAANPQTYSQDTTYVDSDATLASTKVRVGENCTLQYNSTTNALDFVFA